MGGRYGMTQAAKLIAAGSYEAAIVEATRLHARNGEDPDPLIERAEAHSLLGHYSDAVSDLEAAIRVGEEAGVLEVDSVDDAYFSALLGAAKKQAEGDVEGGVKQLARYEEVIPSGRHLKDAKEWVQRLRGELKSEFVKGEG